VRPPGRVEKPQPLLLAGLETIPEPPAATTPAATATPLERLRIGDTLDKEHAPHVANKPFTVSVDVEPQARDGVIVAHGGNTTGYALHLRDGKLVFTVRENKEPVAIVANETPAGRFSAEARLAADGAMTLAINGKQAAGGKAPGPLPVQPQENFCVGFDDAQPVGDYGSHARFSGKIENLKISAGAQP
jgi:uncharacterized Zn-binding protein involved in type VI secretion